MIGERKEKDEGRKEIIKDGERRRDTGRYKGTGRKNGRQSRSDELIR